MEDAPSNISRRRAAARKESSQRYVEKRRQLIKAAAEVFGQRGFESTSIQEVAEALGINRATLYYYVSSKQELFRDVVHEAVRANVRTVEKIRKSERRPEEKVHDVIVALMRSYSENYPYLYVWVQEDMARLSANGEGRDHELARLGRRYHDAVVAIVREGIKSGAFPGFTNPSIVAFGIIGLVNWTHRWFRPDGPATAEEVSEIFSRMVRQGLQGGKG